MKYGIILNGEMPRDTPQAFAKYIIPSIRDFIESQEGKKYITDWMKQHPEYEDEHEYEYDNDEDEP